MNGSIDKLEGIFLGSFFMMIVLGVFYLILNDSRYIKQSMIILIAGTIVSMLGSMLNLPHFKIIGHMLHSIGLIVGIYGKFIKRNGILYIFVSTYLIMQGIGYFFGIEALQAVTITEESTSYSFFGPVELIPLLVTALVYYYYKKVKKIDIAK
ncbi:hypothetical protein RH915_07865 [Serpentinicella sp. ANB-PHB4]|uniref:hypothetical protein n=1 Tax=Serpentinicella sp. ANB-PHB4 TaxID=3074076 RepID=UPI00285D98F7|nr:hypothetical protein [Serpentinicella sp. ANB-PHB4]MDR5659404.1 hypothetical protein [Serpentinicella sp. ANB-PHB4]